MRLIQSSTTTALFRDTRPIYAARQLLSPSRRPLRILSFGCSQGDELITLRMMFPKDRIFGCDIKETSLNAVRAVDHLAEVFISSFDNIRRHGPYDLILAYSSLCVHPLPAGKKISELFPFTLFDEIISLFAETLRPGGILLTRNTSYLISHTSSGDAFAAVECPEIVSNGFVDIYAPDGHVLVSSYQSTVQVKEDVASLTDADLRTCVNMRLPVTDRGSLPCLTWTPPENPGRLIAAWSRSNFTNMPAQVVSRGIHISYEFEGFIRPSGRMFVQVRSTKDSLKGGTFTTAVTPSYAEGDVPG